MAYLSMNAVVLALIDEVQMGLLNADAHMKQRLSMKTQLEIHSLLAQPQDGKVVAQGRFRRLSARHSLGIGIFLKWAKKRAQRRAPHELPNCGDARR